MIISSSPSPGILPAGNRKFAFSMALTDENKSFWQKLDAARFELTAKACYCSLLGACYETGFYGDPVPVKACLRDPEFDFKG